MSDAIDRATVVREVALALGRFHQDEAAYLVPQARAVADHLYEQGLLAPAPLREEWGSSDQSDMNMEPEFRDEPSGWWSYVDTDAEGMAREHAGTGGKVWRRVVTDWEPADAVNRAEGDGRAVSHE